MDEKKVVLITGASRGIGAATAREFAKQGYNVVINYHKSEKEALNLKEEIENTYQVKALIIKCDVSDEIQVKSMIKEVINTFKRIDVLVNNAGIVYDRDFGDITVEEFMNTIKVNVIGGFLTSREVSNYMKPGSSIINVSSTNGTKTISPECLDYNVSKVGLQSLTRDLAYQFKPNIRVNAIAIGWADTDMNKNLDVSYIKEETEKIYLGRFANPTEIAKTILFLASDDASYINGEIVTIDGGY